MVLKNAQEATWREQIFNYGNLNPFFLKPGVDPYCFSKGDSTYKV